MQQESLRSLGTKFLDHDGFYKVYYTLHEFEELQTHLILQILDAGYDFDAVVGMPKGACGIINRLSYIFRHVLIGEIPCKRYNPTTLKSSESMTYVGKEIQWRPSEDGTNFPPRDGDDRRKHLRVLLVDDLVEKGITMQMILKVIQAECIKIAETVTIKNAVLWKKNGTEFEPDFFALAVDPTWIIKYEEASGERIRERLRRARPELAQRRPEIFAKPAIHDLLWKT
ncbi:MAG TPA: phosphoribosyltransferase [Patescibacteria group bacterium]|nr:phosphoribosyltransferase [Patescibacteria group bacterium]